MEKTAQVLGYVEQGSENKFAPGQHIGSTTMPTPCGWCLDRRRLLSLPYSLSCISGDEKSGNSGSTFSTSSSPYYLYMMTWWPSHCPWIRWISRISHRQLNLKATNDQVQRISTQRNTVSLSICMDTSGLSSHVYPVIPSLGKATTFYKPYQWFVNHRPAVLEVNSTNWIVFSRMNLSRN